MKILVKVFGLSTAALLASAPAFADLEEIVVTAQKRSQNQQDVPIAITAISAAELQSSGITNVDDIGTVTPGLQWTTTGTGNAPFLRGVGGANETAGQESPVPIYVDGVYYGFPLTSSLSFNNIDRVEVLKGPQGTLFGRNATGGLISITTKDPSHTTSGDLDLFGGDFDTHGANFYGTTGVTDQIATDLAVYFKDRIDGFGTNNITHQQLPGQNEISLRNKWLYAADDTKITAILDYSHVNDPRGITRDLPGNSVGIGGTTHEGDYWDSPNVITPKAASYSQGISVRLDQKFPGFNLVDILAYRGDKSVLAFDGAVASAAPLDANPVVYQGRQVTEELQLLSNGDGANQWIGGLFFMSSKDGAHLNLYGPLLNLSGVVDDSFGGEIVTHSYSVFGDFVHSFDNGGRITLGARETRDERSLNGDTYLAFLPSVGIPPVYTITTPRDATWTEPTWRAVYDYKVIPDVLLYVSFNRGFKSGNFDAVAPTSPQFNPEILNAYEFGAKTEFLDHRLRLNGDIFWYNYSNLQQEEIEGITEVTTNAAKARIKGVEVDATAVITQQFTLDGGLSYLDGKYLKFTNDVLFGPSPTGGNLAASSFNASGRPLARTPAFTMNAGGTYTVAAASGSYSTSLRAAWNGGFPWEPDGRLYQDAYVIVNLTLGWRTPSDVWGVKLIGHNLANEKYALTEQSASTGDFYAPGDPRTFELHADYKF